MTGTNLQGTNIISMIVPTNHADTYATHDSFYGKGGWREVNTLDERNAIPEERRRIGMVVYVRETFKAYLLKNSLSNAGWVPFNIDDEDYITKDELDEAISEALESYPTKVEVQQILLAGGYATQQWVENYITTLELSAYQKKEDFGLQTTAKTIVGAINELNSKPHIDTYSKAEEDLLLSAKADKVDVYTKAEIDEIIEDIPVLDNVYTKAEVNNLLENKADAIEVTNIENRVGAIEQGDIFVPIEDYEVKCAQYEEQIQTLQEENATLQGTVSTMQTKLNYVYDVIVTPHYDILPDEELK